METPSALHRGDETVRRWWRAAFTLDARGLAAWRIALGLILVADCLLRFRTFSLMFAADGIFPPDILRDFHGTSAKWSLALAFESNGWAAAVLGLEGVAGAWLATGIRSRAASIVAWLAVVSVMRRTEPANNAGDSLLACLLFWSMFLPLDGAWTVLPGRPPRAAVVRSVASMALVLQVAAVYFGAGLSKCNPTWLSGEAVSHALSIHDHGTSLGMLVTGLSWLTRPITWLILAAELAGPVLILLMPTTAIRTTLAAAFILFHIAVWATMSVGLFAPVGIAAWLPLVPTAIWDLGGRARRSDLVPLGRPASIACATAVAAALISFVHGLGWLGDAPLPTPLRQLIVAAALEQEWPMFGVIPRQEQWVYGAATLADGRVVDLLRQGRPLERDRPAGGFASLGTHRWHKLYWVLPRPECRVFAAPTAAALVRRWNAGHAGEARVRSLELRFAMRLEKNGEVALQDMLLAAWPPRGDEGRGNFDRLLEATAECSRPVPDSPR